jgi:hypothetical protein
MGCDHVLAGLIRLNRGVAADVLNFGRAPRWRRLDGNVRAEMALATGSGG